MDGSIKLLTDNNKKTPGHLQQPLRYKKYQKSKVQQTTQKSTLQNYTNVITGSSDLIYWSHYSVFSHSKTDTGI